MNTCKASLCRKVLTNHEIHLEFHDLTPNLLNKNNVRDCVNIITVSSSSISTDISIVTSPAAPSWTSTPMTKTNSYNIIHHSRSRAISLYQ
uniref:Uncharacterized protein n=1 Tax=Arundo donax TaxID=35708 RepID=A0A0A9G6F3_ARUDO